jgi:hypothetical protein
LKLTQIKQQIGWNQKSLGQNLKLLKRQRLSSFAGTILPQAPALVKNQNQDCIEIPFLEQKAVIEQHTCEASREPEEKTCIRYLKEPTVTVIPAKYSHYWCSAG